MLYRFDYIVGEGMSSITTWEIPKDFPHDITEMTGHCEEVKSVVLGLKTNKSFHSQVFLCSDMDKLSNFRMGMIVMLTCLWPTIDFNNVSHKQLLTQYVSPNGDGV